MAIPYYRIFAEEESLLPVFSAKIERSPQPFDGLLDGYERRCPPPESPNSSDLSDQRLFFSQKVLFFAAPF